MAAMLREWFAPIAEEELNSALAEFARYVPGTHVQSVNGKLACSPDTITAHLRKKRAMQIVQIVSRALVTSDICH